MNGLCFNVEMQRVSKHKRSVAELFRCLNLQKSAFMSLKLGSKQIFREQELKRLATFCWQTKTQRKCLAAFAEHQNVNAAAKQLQNKRLAEL